MGDKFNYKQIGKTMQLKKMKESVFHVNLKDGKLMKLIDIENLVKATEQGAAKRGEHIRILIRGTNGAKTFTLKGYDEDLEAKYVDDYYLGKVKDASKFSKFYSLQVHIQKSTK
jgi:hypothetical protein